ncbi:N-acetylneuraminate lyase [Mariniphaga sediminis]|uniref:N-acetylneuraminate lyase n=2 Tax=Mariniphaga sediminis TaxID=1628158 RepID=A0A399CST2_9BACT|nr:N-acetylneuraminate lyase [Mariniphaga sediminis]
MTIKNKNYKNMKEYSKIDGLIAPVFTPMKENADINTVEIPGYADFLISNGLNGVFVNGSSGEGMLLTTDERKMITEAWAPFASENFKFIVHVGSTSYRQAQELALHARDCGAWAISCMGPTFLQPKTPLELVDFCRQVASVVPDLPFYYYHIPERSGVNIRMSEFLKEGQKVIPNLAGIKFTDANFMEMQQCLALSNGRFDITHGQEQTLLCGLSIGVKGAIGTSYNFVPRLYQELLEAFKNRDMEKARELQMESVKITEVIIKYGGGIVGGKAMMKLIGIDFGLCRSPLRNLSSTEYIGLERDLKETGFFDFIARLK